MIATFTTADIRIAIRMEKLTNHKRIITTGYCDGCKQLITGYAITVYPDETPREAFDYYWYSLQTDCKLLREDKS